MVSDKVLKSLEFDKIKGKISEFCVLNKTKETLFEVKPESDYLSAKRRLEMTREGMKLLYNFGVGGLSYYDDMGDILIKAPKGACLSMGELLKVARLLKSGRVLCQSAMRSAEENAPLLRGIINSIFVDEYLERDITTKILSEDAMSDNASERLYQIRRNIKRINEQIREKLSSFLRDGSGKYLQENIITMRRDRYVLPVKSEFKNQISGFIHDQSSTGSTVFIEPTAVLELNNSLRSASVEEQNEIERILSDLSVKVGAISESLRRNEDLLSEIDLTFAKAIYAYKTRAVEPVFTSNGFIEIIKGRHPLIDAKKVVPLDIKLGEQYRYLLVTGPNTGGKTVVLKMVGLFSVMAASGIFVPAAEGTSLSFFDKIFCDVGDEQSIEQSLSTFSSHIKNIVEITENVDGRSLVLIDEIGAGTDPEEGGAIARSVIEYLLNAESFGIITTHYSSLKEFAYGQKDIMNASMEFDPQSFAPLYKINIGIPGSSNAIEISKSLGLKLELIDRAYSLLGGEKISFEKVLREAEASRYKASETERRLSEIKDEEEKVLKEIEEEKKRLEREKEKFYTKAKAESRRMVNEKLEEADEIIDEIKVLFDKAEIDSGDLIKARTLRNKLEDKKYSLDDAEISVTNYKPVKEEELKQGAKVYYKPMDEICEVSFYNQKKKECEILVGSARMKVKISDLFFVSEKKEKPRTTVAVKSDGQFARATEINVIGMDSAEALTEVERFIDGAILSNLEEVKIIHGKGMKVLSSAIHDYLRRNKNVTSFRFGKYGEGERGVTFVRFR